MRLTKNIVRYSFIVDTLYCIVFDVFSMNPLVSQHPFELAAALGSFGIFWILSNPSFQPDTPL